MFAGTDSCPPLLGVKRADTAKCAGFNDAVAKIATSKSIKEVILEARWAKNAEGSSFGAGAGGPRAHLRRRFARAHRDARPATCSTAGWIARWRR